MRTTFSISMKSLDATLSAFRLNEFLSFFQLVKFYLKTFETSSNNYNLSFNKQIIVMDMNKGENSRS